MFIHQNRKCEYALKAMFDLASRYGNGETLSLADISRRRGIPMKYLEQIMLVLKGTGFVESRRGAGGGFLMVRPPASVSIGEIARVFQPNGHSRREAGMRGPVTHSARTWEKERTVAAAGRASHSGGSGDPETFVLGEVWERAEKAASDVLDRASFADLLRRSTALKDSSSGYNYQI